MISMTKTMRPHFVKIDHTMLHNTNSQLQRLQAQRLFLSPTAAGHVLTSQRELLLVIRNNTPAALFPASWPPAPSSSQRPTSRPPTPLCSSGPPAWAPFAAPSGSTPAPSRAACGGGASRATSSGWTLVVCSPRGGGTPVGPAPPLLRPPCGLRRQREGRKRKKIR